MTDRTLDQQIADARSNIQAHFVRPSKFSGRVTRDWSLFFFFRIMSQAEVTHTLDRAKQVMETPDDADAGRELKLDFEQPNLVNAGVPAAPPGPDPAAQFLSWLKILVSADKRDAITRLEGLASALGVPLDQASTSPQEAAAAVALVQNAIELVKNPAALAHVAAQGPDVTAIRQSWRFSSVSTSTRRSTAAS